jgi:hypothetical protein
MSSSYVVPTALGPIDRAGLFIRSPKTDPSE